MFSAQLEESKKRVDEANLRSAESLAVADYLMNGETGKVTYTFGMVKTSSSEGNGTTGETTTGSLGIKNIQRENTTTSGGTTGTGTDNNKNDTARKTASDGADVPKKHKEDGDGTVLTVVVTNGKVDKSGWEKENIGTSSVTTTPAVKTTTTNAVTTNALKKPVMA